MMSASTFGSYNYAVAITPSDTVNLIPIAGRTSPLCDAIYVGATGGNLTVVYENGATAQFAGTLVGTILPVSCIRVNATGTAAASLLALYSV